MAYLYLENKTFINAHLLKERLAEVDDTALKQMTQTILSIKVAHVNYLPYFCVRK
jgi:hypothetical protein